MEKDEFNKLEKLYHYTSFDSCIKILLSNTLLLGKLCDLNDINELYRPLFSKTLEGTDFDYVRKELGKYQQLSLTQDDKSIDRLGFDIPAMWGHYADKGRGVCLVFNKAKLLKAKPSFVLQTASVDYAQSGYRNFSYRQECDVRRYMNSQPDKDEAAGTVLNA